MLYIYETAGRARPVPAVGMHTLSTGVSVSVYIDIDIDTCIHR